MLHKNTLYDELERFAKENTLQKYYDELSKKNLVDYNVDDLNKNRKKAEKYCTLIASNNLPDAQKSTLQDIVLEDDLNSTIDKNWDQLPDEPGEKDAAQIATGESKPKANKEAEKFKGKYIKYDPDTRTFDVSSKANYLEIERAQNTCEIDPDNLCTLTLKTRANTMTDHFMRAGMREDAPVLQVKNDVTNMNNRQKAFNEYHKIRQGLLKEKGFPRKLSKNLTAAELKQLGEIRNEALDKLGEKQREALFKGNKVMRAAHVNDYNAYKRIQATLNQDKPISSIQEALQQLQKQSKYYGKAVKAKNELISSSANNIGEWIGKRAKDADPAEWEQIKEDLSVLKTNSDQLFSASNDSANMWHGQMVNSAMSAAGGKMKENYSNDSNQGMLQKMLQDTFKIKPGSTGIKMDNEQLKSNDMDAQQSISLGLN